jgi:hypothetical protein
VELGTAFCVFKPAYSLFGIRRVVVMSDVNEYRRQAGEAAARVEWAERKLSFERKRRRALEDLAVGEDWLDGKISPNPAAESHKNQGR